jgi:acetyltransferase-like isoleucine patch superfamily enzyme
MAPESRILRRRATIAWRVCWTITSLIVVQIVVCAISAAPVVFGWFWIASIVRADSLAWPVLVSIAIVPSYAVFAVCLLMVAPLATRLLAWQTPEDSSMRVSDVNWPLLRWARYAASMHVVRVIAGGLFRGTPLWTAHLRLSGAKLGKRVYINTLAVSDYNLIECGDDVVIGGGAHISGHTVEGGVVKTGRVCLGNNVTIGLGSVVEIGVEIGSNAQVGALSFVPKYTSLQGGTVYVGAPAVPLEHKAWARHYADVAEVWH